MARLGIFLLIMGIGSLILPLMGRQFVLMSLLDPAQPIPTGNQMEDAFEQMALLMNNAFRLANAPAFPALSLTPIAIYRSAR